MDNIAYPIAAAWLSVLVIFAVVAELYHNRS